MKERVLLLSLVSLLMLNIVVGYATPNTDQLFSTPFLGNSGIWYYKASKVSAELIGDQWKMRYEGSTGAPPGSNCAVNGVLAAWEETPLADTKIVLVVRSSFGAMDSSAVEIGGWNYEDYPFYSSWDYLTWTTQHLGSESPSLFSSSEWDPQHPEEEWSDWAIESEALLDAESWEILEVDLPHTSTTSAFSVAEATKKIKERYNKKFSKQYLADLSDCFFFNVAVIPDIDSSTFRNEASYNSLMHLVNQLVLEKEAKIGDEVPSIWVGPDGDSAYIGVVKQNRKMTLLHTTLEVTDDGVHYWTYPKKIKQKN